MHTARRLGAKYKAGIYSQQLQISTIGWGTVGYLQYGKPAEGGDVGRVLTQDMQGKAR